MNSTCFSAYLFDKAKLKIRIQHKYDSKRSFVSIVRSVFQEICRDKRKKTALLWLPFNFWYSIFLVTV